MAISKESQSAYQRWEMTSFGDERPSAVAQRRAAEAAAAAAAAPPPPPPEPAAPAIPLPTIEEIEAIHEAARQEGFEQGHAEGLQSGHDAGYQDGLAQGRAEAAEEAARLKELAASFGDAVTYADEAISHDVLELALNLARNMVRIALDVKPDLIIPIVREAIDYLPTLQHPAILFLNPEDVPIVKNGMAHELETGGWRIVEDEHIARGGCRVETASNQIDAQVAQRWQRLAHALGKDTEWLE
ncbi:flagellar assembly protein FliH [Massilia sp. TN1-12]|uniref:flagellar assembly protein FliH n=1 Tax=Massilia paldalensis TaxID=3377675 RepID=UPI00384FBAF6